jgi:hypothetical protein
MKTLYCNGDSFVFGMECSADHSRDESNKELSFPAYVRTALGCTTYINNAYNGATNDFIFRTTVADLIELEKTGTDPKDVFVLVGWTSLERSAIATGNILPDSNISNLTEEAIDHGIIFINPGFQATICTQFNESIDISKSVIPFLTRYVWADSVLLSTHRAQVLCLEEFLKNRGYKYLFVATCGNYENFTLLQESTNWFWPTELTFEQFAFKNHVLSKRVENHFDKTPHEEFGKLLVDYITKNSLY